MTKRTTVNMEGELSKKSAAAFLELAMTLVSFIQCGYTLASEKSASKKAKQISRA